MQIVNEINSRTYELQPAQCFIIKYPAIREVFCANFRDRIVQHYVFLRLNPIIEKMLIYDTASCKISIGVLSIIRTGLHKISPMAVSSMVNIPTRRNVPATDLLKFFSSLAPKCLAVTIAKP